MCDRVVGLPDLPGVDPNPLRSEDGNSDYVESPLSVLLSDRHRLVADSFHRTISKGNRKLAQDLRPAFQTVEYVRRQPTPPRCLRLWLADFVRWCRRKE